jgi:branched-chain amino acid transport system ATP-binding protein
MTVCENVQMALLSDRQQLMSFTRRASRMYRPEALELLKQVGIVEQEDRPCSTLAYGDLKRVELAVALANNPRLLLMDEPTAGMAPKERVELMALTADIVKERNLSVLFTEHDMDVVFAHADRILVLNRGKLIADDTPENVRNNPEVRMVYLGTETEEIAHA